LSAGTRRSGSSKFGPARRAGQHNSHHVAHDEVGRPAETYTGRHGGQGADDEVAGPAEPYTGRHAGPRRPTAPKRARKAVPAAAVAATIAAGAAAYGLVGGGSPQAAQLTDAALPAMLNNVAQSGLGNAGGAEDAASATVKATEAVGGGVGRPSARRHAKTSPRASASATATASASASASASAKPKPSASRSAAASPTATASASATHTASARSCSLNYELLPENVTAIVDFLLAHGYSENAAAGIAGNMYQESKGNPESEGMGGGGLIGFTPLPAGYVTGDPAVDLETQLNAVLTYNQQWAAYLPALEDAATPADAASIYVTDFERAGIPAAATREASATDVAEACGI